MSTKIATETGIVELKPNPDWSWGPNFNGEVTLKTTASHPLKSNDHIAVLENDLVQSIREKVVGKAKYTAIGFNLPGTITSIQINIIPNTLVDKIRVNGEKILSSATEGFFTVVCGEPAKTPKGDPDLSMIKNGTWRFKEPGQSSMVLSKQPNRLEQKQETVEQRQNVSPVKRTTETKGTTETAGAASNNQPIFNEVSRISLHYE